MKRFRRPFAALAVLFIAAAPITVSLLLLAPRLRAQGSLTPPGAPSPTLKTLGQIEPRTDIATLPGSASAVTVISQAGSYYLSGNLAGASGKDAIVVTAAGVTIDLNGFTISADPSRAAILASGIASVTVRNGRLIGGNLGVRGGARLLCADLVVEGGSIAAILATTDAQIERCRAVSGAIQLSDRGLVSDCDVSNNTTAVSVGQGSLVQRTRVSSGGITTTDDALVLDCTVTSAPSVGIVTGSRCVVRGCTVNGAGSSGILLNDRSQALNCAVTNAGQITQLGNDGGIAMSIECIAENCAVTACAIPGFVGSSSAKLRNCISSNNTVGFKCGAQARLVDCTAFGNTGLGISADRRSIASGCVVAGNSAGGLYFTSIGTIVENCLASGNTGGAGLRVDSGTVRDCEARENQGGPGIRASTASTVVRNNSSSNGIAAAPQNGFLIEGGRSRVEGNHAYNNTNIGFEVTNTSSANSVLFIGNSAGSNDISEFTIGAGNAAGPILTQSQVSTTTIPTANYNL